MVEHRSPKPGVAGSSPAGPAIILKSEHKMFKKIFTFFKNVKTELSYVSWPTKADLKEGTTVVIIMSTIVAIFLSVIDTGFGFIIRKLLFKG